MELGVANRFHRIRILGETKIAQHKLDTRLAAERAIASAGGGSGGGGSGVVEKNATAAGSGNDAAVDRRINQLFAEHQAKWKADAAEAKKCVVCLDADKSMLFQCGRNVCCAECGANKALKKCPVCDAKIAGRVKFYQ